MAASMQAFGVCPSVSTRSSPDTLSVLFHPAQLRLLLATPRMAAPLSPSKSGLQFLSGAQILVFLASSPQQVSLSSWCCIEGHGPPRGPARTVFSVNGLTRPSVLGRLAQSAVAWLNHPCLPRQTVSFSCRVMMFPSSLRRPRDFFEYVLIPPLLPCGFPFVPDPSQAEDRLSSTILRGNRLPFTGFCPIIRLPPQSSCLCTVKVKRRRDLSLTALAEFSQH